MHHCVGTYGNEVRLGYCYVYSIRRNDERVATVALSSHNGRAYLQQIRGPCKYQAIESNRRYRRALAARARAIAAVSGERMDARHRCKRGSDF